MFVPRVYWTTPSLRASTAPSRARVAPRATADPMKLTTSPVSARREAAGFAAQGRGDDLDQEQAQAQDGGDGAGDRHLAEQLRGVQVQGGGGVDLSPQPAGGAARGEPEVAGDVGERGVDHAGGLRGDRLLGLAERVQGLDAVAAHGAPIGTTV